MGWRLVGAPEKTAPSRSRLVVAQAKTATSRSRLGGARRGFTLIELLVVISLIAILLAVSVPLTASLARHSALSSSINQVSAALSSAHAIALRDAADTAAIFSHDANGLTRIYLAGRVPDTSTPPVAFLTDASAQPDFAFRVLDDRPAEKLPSKIRVAGPDYNQPEDPGGEQWRLPGNPDDAGGDFANGTLTDLCVWFGPDGTVRTSTPAGTRRIYFHDPAATNTVFDAGPTPRDRVLTPVPYVAIYDRRDLQQIMSALDDEADPADPTRRGFINQPIAPGDSENLRARVMMFNRYSGTLMRR